MGRQHVTEIEAMSLNAPSLVRVNDCTVLVHVNSLDQGYSAAIIIVRDKIRSSHIL